MPVNNLIWLVVLVEFQCGNGRNQSAREKIRPLDNELSTHFYFPLLSAIYREGKGRDGVYGTNVLADKLRKGTGCLRAINEPKKKYLRIIYALFLKYYFPLYFLKTVVGLVHSQVILLAPGTWTIRTGN